MSSADGEPESDMMMVHAALALGNLSNESELLGRAIHMKDDIARRQVRDIMAVRVKAMFRERDWSSSKPFRITLRDTSPTDPS